jgi:predicted nucleic acid-binding protein
MPPVIIADASCLILLEKIGALELLSQLFGRITVTDMVAAEYGLPLPEWVAVQAVRDARRLQFLTLTLDRGEASSIALALEQADCLLIMDERRGRLVAQRLQLNVTGTLGVLLQAKNRGVIVAVKPFLDVIGATNFRLSPSLVQAVLSQAGE